MPLTGPNSYLPTMNEFIAHWTQVNAESDRGGVGLTLKGGYTLSNFTTDRNVLQAALTAIIPADNTRQMATAQRELLKTPLRARLTQFRAAVQSFLQGTAYQESLPTLPHPDAAATQYLTPLEDAVNLWTRINADTTLPGFTPPLTLAGGYTQATFNTDVNALRTAFMAVSDAEGAARLARDQRDVLLPPIRQRMVQYRAAAKANFPADHPLVQSLPALSPPAGATPDPVTLTGTWDATNQQASLTWTASTDANLDHYSVRTAPGSRYRAADETVLTSVPAGTVTFATDAGLAAPNTPVAFKVYVVLSTGNEKGSNAVTVTRPT